MPWVSNIGEGAAEKWAGSSETVVVSITEPGRKANLQKGFAAILRLGFQDYDPGDAEEPRKVPPTATLFDRRMAAQLARFLRKHRGKNILIHCAAGISRSGGIIEAVLEAFPEYEDRGWQRFPNIHVKVLCKRALGLVPLGYDEKRPRPIPDPRIKFG